MNRERSPSLQGQSRTWKWLGIRAVSQQSHVMAHHRLREDGLERRIILVGLEDSQLGVGPIQGVVDRATFRRSSWSWHVLDDERGFKNGSGPLFALVKDANNFSLGFFAWKNQQASVVEAKFLNGLCIEKVELELGQRIRRQRLNLLLDLGSQRAELGFH
jgi:hypothetical protein